MSGSLASDAQLSADMTAALGVATTVVSTQHCTVVIVYKALTVAVATSAASLLAASIGVQTMPFQLMPSEVRFIVSQPVSAADAATAMGYSTVAAVPAVCVDLYVDNADALSDVGPAMAMLPHQIAVATDSLRLVPAPASSGPVSKKSQRMMLGGGAAAVVVVIVAIAVVMVEVFMRSNDKPRSYH